MSRFFSAVIFLLLPLAMYGQDGQNVQATIRGNVVDETGTSMAGASVAIYDAAMDHVITGTSTQKQGNFNIDVDGGSYVVKITFISYKSYQKKITVQAGTTKKLGTIKLQPTSQQLEETTVRAEQSSMEMSFDRRTFNVGQDITSLGGSAINVLRNVPSISMDIDGNISLRGNESVRILINGHPSHMVSNGIQALRSIPSNLIKKVEIITNPSSKYAAEGSGGIINIVLVKNRRLGFNGSVAASTGYPQDHDISTNLNYQKGNFNWFLNSSFGYRADPEGGEAFQRFAGPDTTYMYREHTDSDESEYEGDLRLGTDYYISETQTLTASTFLNWEDGSDAEDVNYTDLEYSPGARQGDILGRVLRDNNEESLEKEADFNLRYENKIDGNNHKLTADARFEIGHETSHTSIEEDVLRGSDAPVNQRTEDGEDDEELHLNVEYERPLGKKGKLEAGLRSNTEWNDNSYFVAERQNGTYVPLPDYNGNFLYRENVNAAYVTLGAKWGHFSGEVGLRGENTRIHTEIKNTDAVNNQNYLNLFPSLFLNYSFNESNSIQLSYSRRLSRPRSHELIPFTDYSNSRNQFVGNPDLRPEFSHSYEAGYQRSWESGSLLTSFYYRYRTDVTERISEQRQGVLRRFPINLATEKAWGIEFSGNQNLFQGLTLRLNANLYHSNRDGAYHNQTFSSQAQSFRSRMRLRWDFSDAWHYQASFRYRGPHETTQGSRDGIKTMDTGISHDLWSRKAQLSLNLRDVFNSQNFNHTTTTDGNPATDFYSQRSYRWSSRSVSLNFRYYFQADKTEQHRRGRHHH